MVWYNMLHRKRRLKFMSRKFIKNKALCFLLTIAAICPIKEIKATSVIVGEKVADVADRSCAVPSRAELDELVRETETLPQPVQSDENITLSEEEKQKRAQEAKELLKRLNSENVAPKQEISSDLKEVIALSDDSSKIEKEFSKSGKTTEKSSEESILPVKSVQTNQSFHAESSLVASKNPNEETKEEIKNTKLETVKHDPIQTEFQKRSKKLLPEEKIAAIAGLSSFVGLSVMAIAMLAVPFIKPKKRPKRRISSNIFEDDSTIIRGIIESVTQSSENSTGKKVEQKGRVLTEDIMEQEFTDTVSVPESETEKMKVVVPVTIDVTEQESPQPEIITVNSDKKQVSEASSEDFSDIVQSKNSHELFQWLCAVKSIYDIQKERAVLKREMARAKNEDNKEEIDRINARRKILNAKRRAACLRANSREMQTIKELRRQLTKKMTLAKRGKHIDAATREVIKEEVMATRWSLRQQVKEMNGRIKAFDYTKQWRSFLDKYKQSRQAA